MPNTKKKRPSRARKERILAIDPGSRTMGLGLYSGTDLIHSRVVDLRYRRDLKVLVKRAKAEIRKELELFDVDTVVLETTYFWANRRPKAARLIVIVDAIKALAKRHGAKVREIPARTARATIAHNGNATKEEVAKLMASRYPELGVWLEESRPWADGYGSHATDACVTGFAYLVQQGLASPIHPPAGL